MTGEEEPREVPTDELFAHLAATDPTLKDIPDGDPVLDAVAASCIDAGLTPEDVEARLQDTLAAWRAKRALRAEVNAEERLQAIIAAQSGEPGSLRDHQWFDRPQGFDNPN